EEAEKEDRRGIGVLIDLIHKLMQFFILEYTVEEQEIINNFVDSILSPLLHRPEKEKLFFMVNDLSLNL
ncbi:hypothetical protein K501DRAFT_168621, partial [Backusella circina FSU 941]